MKASSLRWRAAPLAALLLLSIVLTSCGSKVAASEKAISVGRSAIEVADDYLDNKITADRALSRLDDLQAKMAYVDDLPRDTPEQQDQRSADFLISTSIFLLNSSIFHDKYGSGKYDDIKKQRNDIAKLIGEKTR